MNRFFVPDLGAQLKRRRVALSDEETHHLVRVRRLQIGDQIELFDGCGEQALAQVSAITRSGVDLQLLSEQPPRRTPAVEIHVGVPVLVRQRMAVVVEKLTELGVASISFVQTARTENRPSKPDRWQRVAVAAAKQSGALRLPEFVFGEEVAAFVKRTGPACLLLEPRAQTPLASVASTLTPGAQVGLLIGPEGGWTDVECESAAACGVVAVRLGPTILRVETAAVVAAGLVIGCCPEGDQLAELG